MLLNLYLSNKKAEQHGEGVLGGGGGGETSVIVLAIHDFVLLSAPLLVYRLYQWLRWAPIETVESKIRSSSILILKMLNLTSWRKNDFIEGSCVQRVTWNERKSYPRKT